MNNLSLYCITLDPNHYDKIKKLGYHPVGLGEKSFTGNWMTAKDGQNITDKNKFYGEYTFHYWIWKNYLNQLNDNWIGFCQYRKFWGTTDDILKVKTLDDLHKVTLKKIPEKLNSYESILGAPYFINQFRFSKFIKRNLGKMLLSPSLIFNKNRRNIKFHFDMWHGEGNLDKAIELLDIKDRKDFESFVLNNVSFNPHNMFICKSKNILKKYYESVFPWLFECEKFFKDYQLEGYGLQRIYGFLAERYMSYWFQKYTNSITYPILFKDISELD